MEITFRRKPVEEVDIRGDVELILRIPEFLAQHHIKPAARGGMSVGGRYVGFFFPNDAKRIEAWLRGQGATKRHFGLG